MNNSSVSAIKRSQKEALLNREISKMFHTIMLDDDRLSGLFINRVELSVDKSWCTIYFFTQDGFDAFKDKLEILKLYKPSMRKSLTQAISSRYVPNLRFEYDSTFEKHQKLESIIEKVSQELKKSEDSE